MLRSVKITLTRTQLLCYGFKMAEQSNDFLVSFGKTIGWYLYGSKDTRYALRHQFRIEKTANCSASHICDIEGIDTKCETFAKQFFGVFLPLI